MDPNCSEGGLMYRLGCRLRFYVQGTVEDEFIVKVVTSIMLALHAGFSVAVFWGGSARFSLPSYEPLLNMVNQQVWVWGAWIGLSALLMAVPYKWVSIAGLGLGMVWMIFWCSAFSLAVVKYPTATATAVVAYAGFAAINAALLTARLLEHPRGE